VLPDRTTAVHYLKFPLSARMAERLVVPGSPAVKLVVRHPNLTLAKALPPAVVGALAGDLLDAPRVD
jgi:hypothetical protein